METEHIIQATTACIAVMSLAVSIVVYVHTVSKGNDRTIEDGRRAVRSVVVPAVTSFNGTLNSAALAKREPTADEYRNIALLYNQSRDAFYVDQDSFSAATIKEVDRLVDRVEATYHVTDISMLVMRDLWYDVMEKIKQEAVKRP